MYNLSYNKLLKFSNVEWSVFTFLIDVLSVAVREKLDLLLKLLLLSCGLFLQVGLLRAHRQSQPVCVLLNGHV